jgi:oxygen-independent coproporphyrinogen-3 oxidase
LFRRWLEEGRLARQSEERELAFFAATRGALAARGFEAYEISNFATTGRQCSHNINYWHNAEYVGIGPSAVSKLGATRAGNLKGIAAYTRRLAVEGEALAWEETLAPAQSLAETWWLGLRLSAGLAPEEARRRCGFAEASDPAEGVARELCRTGLLELEEPRYRLSARGLPLADHVARQFLQAALP